MKYSIIESKDFKKSTWAGGKTWELIIEPEGSSYSKGMFDLRVSSASVELDQSTFSKLEGFERIIIPLTGELTLWHSEMEEPDGSAINLKPYDLYHFSGGGITKSRGKVQDFNVFYRPGLEPLVKVVRLGEGLVLDKKTSIVFSWEPSDLVLEEQVLKLEAFSMIKVQLGIKQKSNLKALAGGPLIVVSY